MEFDFDGGAAGRMRCRIVMDVAARRYGLLRGDGMLLDGWHGCVDTHIDNLTGREYFTVIDGTAASVRDCDGTELMRIPDGEVLFVSAGLVCVRANGGMACLRADGTNALGRAYRDIRPFIRSGGRLHAMVRRHDDGKWNFSDENGKILLGAWHDEVRQFADGMAAVADDFAVACRHGSTVSRKMGYVSDDGAPMPGGRLFRCGKMFQCGVARVMNFRYKWNYVRKDGTFVLGKWRDDVGRFSEAEKVAVVSLEPSDASRGEASGYLYGLVGLDGAEVTDRPYRSISGVFHCGYTLAALPGGKACFLDARGRMLGGAAFDDASDFSDAGTARVRTADGWHMVDAAGRLADDPDGGEGPAIGEIVSAHFDEMLDGGGKDE